MWFCFSFTCIWKVCYICDYIPSKVYLCFNGSQMLLHEIYLSQNLCRKLPTWKQTKKIKLSFLCQVNSKNYDISKTPSKNSVKKPASHMRTLLGFKTHKSIARTISACDTDSMCHRYVCTHKMMRNYTAALRLWVVEYFPSNNIQIHHICTLIICDSWQD